MWPAEALGACEERRRWGRRGAIEGEELIQELLSSNVHGARGAFDSTEAPERASLSLVLLPSRTSVARGTQPRSSRLGVPPSGGPAAARGAQVPLRADRSPGHRRNSSSALGGPDAQDDASERRTDEGRSTGAGATSVKARRVDSVLSDLDLMALLPRDAAGTPAPRPDGVTVTGGGAVDGLQTTQLQLFMDALGNDSAGGSTGTPSSPQRGGPAWGRAATSGCTSPLRKASSALGGNKRSLSVQLNEGEEAGGGSPRVPAGLASGALTPRAMLAMLQSLNSSTGQPVAARASPQLMTRLLTFNLSGRSSAVSSRAATPGQAR